MPMFDNGVPGVMEGNRTRYRSFMLRLWREEGEDLAWRASLEDPLTGERQVFPDLEALFDYLAAVNGIPASFEKQDENPKEERT